MKYIIKLKKIISFLSLYFYEIMVGDSYKCLINNDSFKYVISYV